MQQVSATYTGADQRTAPRTDVYARIPASTPDGRQLTVTLVNISADGLLFRSESQLPESVDIQVTLPVLGRVSGRTIWSLGGRTGMQFDQRISEGDYLPLLRALGVRTAGDLPAA